MILSFISREKIANSFYEFHSLAKDVFHSRDYDWSIKLFYKAIQKSDFSELIRLEQTLNGFDTNQKNILQLKNEVSTIIKQRITLAWQKIKDENPTFERQYFRFTNTIYNYNYFIATHREELAFKVYEICKYTDKTEEKLDSIILNKLYAAKELNDIKWQKLQPQIDSTIQQIKAEIKGYSINQKLWFDITDRYGSSEICGITESLRELEWFEIERSFFEIDVLICQKNRDIERLYELGIEAGELYKDGEIALGLLIEALSNIDEESKHWFYKSGYYEVFELKEAFECLQTEEQQQTFFDFIMAPKPYLLEIPLYQEIYPTLISPNLKSKLVETIKKEKNLKKQSLVLEPSLYLDKLVDIAIEEAKTTHYYTWINLLITRFKAKFPSYHKLADLNEFWFSQFGYSDLIEDAETEEEELAVIKEIEKNKDIDLIIPYSGKSVLMLACHYQRKLIVQFLLENGANTTLVLTNGQTALTEAFELWLSLFDDDDYYSPYLPEELVIDLIEKGVPVHPTIENDISRHPLALLVCAGYIKAIKLLIKKGTRILYKSDNAFFILEKALYFGRLDILKLLIQEGINPKGFQRKSFYSNFDYSVKEQTAIDCIHFLNKNGAQVEPLSLFEDE